MKTICCECGKECEIDEPQPDVNYYTYVCDDCCSRFKDCDEEFHLCSELKCPLGGDETNDCEGCAYSGDYHFVDGECVERDEDENDDGKRWYTVSFQAKMNDADIKAMKKCFYDAMKESMEISQCRCLDIDDDCDQED